ncbi:hypothetical protein AAC387_Pa07g1868 [Persea americana]
MEDLTSPQGSDEGIKVDPSSSSIPEKAGNIGASVTIEINDLDRNRATSIKERLRIERGRPKESSTRFSCSIYRVPHFLRQYNGPKSSQWAHFTMKKERINYEIWRSTNGDIYKT